MADKGTKLRLHVEGNDDAHSLISLLYRHGVDYPPERKREEIPPELPLFHPAGSVEKLLDSIATKVKASTGLPVGFVLDADAPIADRWRAVRDRLGRVGVVAAGDAPPAEGFIGESTTYKVPAVGVWLMPDNRRDGKLEDFLIDLIDSGDSLIGHARAATSEAIRLGATFSEPDKIKAEVHAWLAWQDEPGKPFGQAMAARYFLHDAAVAARFVAWFKRLYGLAE